MEPLCYLYGPHGWRSRTGQFTSDIEQAAEYELSQAREIVATNKSNEGFTLVLVRKDDLP